MVHLDGRVGYTETRVFSRGVISRGTPPPTLPSSTQVAGEERRDIWRAKEPRVFNDARKQFSKTYDQDITAK